MGPNFGRIGYEAYCQSTGGVSLISGAKLPEWDDLSPEIKQAWHDAGEAVSKETVRYLKSDFE